MPDRLFTEPKLAALYDAWCAKLGRDDFDFYLPLIMAAGSVLDVGCGTGELLRLARDTGHAGRLVGVDPAGAMLDVARRRPDIEWLLADARHFAFESDFDLVVMTGHAFQVLLTDDEILASLQNIRRSLSDSGRFVFETRNPEVREWENWGQSMEFEYGGSVVRISGPPPVYENGLLRFEYVATSPSWDRPKSSSSILRFLARDSLTSFLEQAGLSVERQFGTWNRASFTDASPEIITVARRR